MQKKEKRPKIRNEPIYKNLRTERDGIQTDKRIRKENISSLFVVTLISIKKEKDAILLENCGISLPNIMMDTSITFH